MARKQKIAIVTGAGRGIGRSVATAFANKGERVALIARNRDEIQHLEACLNRKEERALAVPCDVSCPRQVAAMVDQVVIQLGEPDILVNNAGTLMAGSTMEIDPEHWKYGLEVNLFGAFLCSQAVLKHMIKRKAGHIINVASRAAIKPAAGLSSYCVSKAGLVAFTKCLHEEQKANGICVFGISPGFVNTDMLKSFSGEKSVDGVMNPEEIANIISFLISVDAKPLKGSVIEAHGDLDSLEETSEIPSDPS